MTTTMYRRRIGSTYRRGSLRSVAMVTLGALAILPLGGIGLLSPPAFAADPAVALGTAAPFSVLGGGVSSTGATAVTGDIGASPGTVTGFPPGMAGGTTHSGDAAATQARADLATAYAEVASRPSTANLPLDIGNTQMGPGVYHTTTALGITGTLTLSGDANAVFVFQVDGALNTAAASKVVLTDGAVAANVVWQVAGAVGTGADSSFAGTILSAAAITLGAGTDLVGRALTTAAVVMADNAVAFTAAGAPAIAIAGGAAATATTATPILSGTTDESPGANVTVRVDGQASTATVQPGGTWSTTSPALTNGAHTVTATVRDADGNNGVATQVLTLNLAADPVSLASAGAYSVLGGSGVTSSGATNVTGDLGASAGPVAGFPPGTVGGTVHAGDPAAVQAQADLHTAYADAAGRTPFQELPADLGGATFGPGVYHTGVALGITGTVILDGGGNANSVFIFQVGAALNTAASSTVILTNGALAAHVFWPVLGAVVAGATSHLAGVILATGAVTLGAGTTMTGSALSYGTVTLADSRLEFATGPPLVTITGGGTATTALATPIVSGTTNAAVATTVTVRVAGQALTTTVPAGGTWSVTASPLANGPHTVTATVRDPDGNNGVATQVLTVNVPPLPVRLHSARTYSVLAGTSVVNTGPTALSNDLGVSPSASIVGFPDGTVGGEIHAGDDAAAQAQTDLHGAYDNAGALIPFREIDGDLIGQTLTAGVYHGGAAIALTGTLTLDGQNNPDAVFVFQVDGALDPAAASRIILINGAQASHVFWRITGAVTIGASSVFVGTIMAAGAITVGDGAILDGSALSYGTVTLSDNLVSTTVLPEGVLSISAPDGSVDLGSGTNTLDGRTFSGRLGQVQVTDFRDIASGGSWVATVTSTDFTSVNGSVSAHLVGYRASSITTVGTASLTAYDPGDLSSDQVAVSAVAIAGDNTATWNPLLSVFVPASTVAGVYTATITHSVA